METQRQIILNGLNIEGVIVHLKETIDWNGQEVVVSDTKTHYPNNVTGRKVFEETFNKKREADNIYQAVMLIWGEEPVVSEEPTEESLETKLG